MSTKIKNSRFFLINLQRLGKYFFARFKTQNKKKAVTTN